MTNAIAQKRTGDTHAQAGFPASSAINGHAAPAGGFRMDHAGGVALHSAAEQTIAKATTPEAAVLRATTLSFENMHQHGALFANLLKARRQAFIVQNNWDLPEADGMEYDQYDTPASRWIAVHEADTETVLAGIRLTPTTAKCGIYTYMIRDAQRGLLDSIPSDLLDFEAPIDPHIWESSRVFVARDVSSKLRSRVQISLMHEMMRAATDLGAERILGLVPAVWSRWIGRLNLEADPAGPVMRIDGVNTQVAMMTVGRAKNTGPL